MASVSPDELRSFHEFIARALEEGGPSVPTPEEALDLWRLECAASESDAETVQALREALDDMRDGDTGIPAQEFIEELRRKYRLPDVS